MPNVISPKLTLNIYVCVSLCVCVWGCALLSTKCNNRYREKQVKLIYEHFVVAQCVAL